MIKPIAILLLVAVCLAGCSRSKDVVIPTDSSKWSDLAEKTKDLSAEEKRLLGAYLVRSAMRETLAHEQGVPFGTTVGTAIEQEKEFESKQKIEEAKAEALKKRAIAARDEAVNAMRRSLTFAMLSMKYSPKNIYADQFEDRLLLVFVVKNNRPKDISGVKGTMSFNDMFGTSIKKINLAIDETIPSQSEKTFSSYFVKLNQFISEDEKLATSDTSKMKVTFEPEMIVYADGTNEKAPDEP